jgi:membrane protein DedA with SNARE-associated domain
MRPITILAARALGILAGAALAVVVLGTVVEAVLDYFAVSLDASVVAQTIFKRPELITVGLVGIEEAGVPLPISGDLLIMYSAAGAGRNPATWLVLGVGFELAVLTGSSFLFLVSSRWGTRLLRGPIGRALQLTPARIERAEHWFKRWGIWAVIFGRQVPGFRVAVTVVAASFQLSYRLFIFGVAVAAAGWITLFMALGLLVGPQAERLLGAHQNSSLLILGGLLMVGLLYFAARWAFRRTAYTTT